MLLGTTAIVAVFVLDQITKWFVLRELGPNGSRDEFVVIPGVLRFIFVRNTGSAFGMFQNASGILTVAAIVAICVLLIYYVRSASRDWILSLALGLQLGGAVGNIVDRFQHGYVVDWINVPRFPTFNVADSAITIGVVLLMWALLFRGAGVSDDERTSTETVDRRASIQEDI